MSILNKFLSFFALAVNTVSLIYLVQLLGPFAIAAAIVGSLFTLNIFLILEHEQ